MPTVYKRKKTGAARGTWTEDNLKEALMRLEAGEIGVNEAARYYGIPSRTLRRRRKTGNNIKTSSLGPQGVFGVENEKRLVKHIQRLEKCGFAPDKETIRTLAFQFAEKLGLNHRFNLESRMAGYDWLSSFLRRNPELSIRQAQGLSLARGEGINKESVDHFFFLILSEVFEEHEFFTRPGSIYNMDETGCQLNNVPGKVVATKGAKDVHVLTCTERGENITVIACCNAEGQYLPPSVIFKGVREKKEFSDGLPPGSMVFMNERSSYISIDIFFRWLKDVFVPRKPQGKTLLILDGHASHLNCYDLLEFADNNDIIVVCLPSHTTQALQPLDRSFFKPLKHYFKKEARNWIVNHPGRTIGRIQAAELIDRAWKRAASVHTAINGFRKTGIFPLNQAEIPNYFFSISEEMKPTCEQSESSKSSDLTSTPTKLLHQISPVPKLEERCRKRKKQSAMVITSQEHIKEKKLKSAAKLSKASKQLVMDTPIETGGSDHTNNCLECEENYYLTKETVDWIKCVKCQKWLHESCTMYGNLCNVCGKTKIRENKKKNIV
ncbi:uncharacterized protein LOC129216581 [Uloborus diversus]|uniref:uncharacterized protein LOC129216581 n=1 Tax=Uloborus diversus TaxID=327109 RepID=UPI0024099B0F|nr:uncharacterized protein LOC129216581 [Uloborus diversus]